MMKITSILACFCLVLLISCKESPDRPEPLLDTDTTPVTTTTSSTVPPPASVTTNANSNVPHYKCPNECAGSGGPSAGTCPVCGIAYVHNQEYHNQPNSNPAANPAATANPANPATPPPPAEPAQNASGVWHYTCAKGCPGGSGAKGTCATCGGPLTHNADYHNS